MINLEEKKCIPCSIDTQPLTQLEISEYMKSLKDGWILLDDSTIEKTFKFSNFAKALNFTNLVGNIAEQEGHHPSILLSWGMVKVRLKTHKINGLSENDFILASKIDSL